VQKSVTHLLTGGVSVLLQSMVGLLLLAFYHPYFLAFDVLLLILLWLVWALYGKKAILSAIKESTAKYETASWLEDIAHANLFLQSTAKKEFALNQADDRILNYLSHRKFHFRRVFKQIIMLLVIYALMSALILGLGGFLVADGQLTLGQLVAAELIITVILASFAKSGKYLESFYDLVAAVDKLSAFYELPTIESSDSKLQLKGHDLVLENVEVRVNQRLLHLDLQLDEGKNYVVYSSFYSSTCMMMDLLNGHLQKYTGSLRLGDIDYQDVAMLDIRDQVRLVDRPVFFRGSIADNLTHGMQDIERSKIIHALETVDIDIHSDYLPEGLDTQIFASGYPLWPSQLIRLDIARALLSEPKVLMLSPAFDQIEDQRKVKILLALRRMSTTVILFSHLEQQVVDFDQYLWLKREQLLLFDTAQAFQESKAS
jgi:putative ABC transport system ATP-binding protein